MKRSFLVLWAFVAALACWRLDPATRPITGDNQLYFYLAERAASGVAPHVSLVDTKGQLGVLTTAAGIAAGRAAGIDDVAASRAVSIGFAVFAVALAAELAALLAGSAAAGHVAALAMIASRGFLEHAATGSNPKVFLAAFLLLAHVAIARRRNGAQPAAAADAVAGLAAGAAFACWQPALLVVGAVALEALAGARGSWRRLARVLAWAAVPLASYGAYFAWKGALGEQLYQEFAMTLGSVHAPHRFLSSMLFVMTEARGMSSPLRVGPLAFVVLALGVLLRGTSLLRSRPGALAFAAGAVVATAFTLYDHQGVPDLFLVAPYFAVATGVLAVVVAPAERAGEVRRLAVPLAFSTLLLVQLVRDEALRPVHEYSLADQRRAAGEVRALAGQGSVWVYQAVHLLGLAHLDNHVPYGLFYDDVRSVLDLDAWRPVRDGRMPRFILQGRRDIPGSARYLEAGYEEATTPDLEAQALRLWKARAAAGTPALE